MSQLDQTTLDQRTSGNKPGHPVSAGLSRRLRAFALGRWFWAAAAVLFVLVWGTLFARSLSVDESGTFWMAHDGFLRALQKTLHWPGQSLLFSAITALFCFDGSPLRDTLLRIPALLGIAAASYFLYRIAERRIGKYAGIAAVCLFVFHPDVTATGYQARPYALAMAAVTASCWALGEWENSRGRKHLLSFTAASILVLYLHYFFAVILLVDALYLGFIFFLQRRTHRWREIAVAGVVIVLSVLPLIPHLRLLLDERHTLSFTPPPGLADLTYTLAPPTLLAGLMVAACLVGLTGPVTFRRRVRPNTSFLFLLTAWWLVGPVLFLGVSKATTLRIFLPRYLTFSLPAQALLFTWLGYRLFGAAGTRGWALAAAALFFANPVASLRHREWGEELLPLMRMVRAEPRAPVFFTSMLTESRFYDWRAGNRPDSYLFAPLVAYPIDNPVLPLPITLTDGAKNYISGLLDSRLRGESELLFVERNDSWEPWIVDRMRQAGFRATIRRAGDFTLFLFRRQD